MDITKDIEHHKNIIEIVNEPIFVVYLDNEGCVLSNNKTFNKNVIDDNKIIINNLFAATESYTFDTFNDMMNYLDSHYIYLYRALRITNDEYEEQFILECCDASKYIPDHIILSDKLDKIGL